MAESLYRRVRFKNTIYVLVGWNSNASFPSISTCLPTTFHPKLYSTTFRLLYFPNPTPSSICLFFRWWWPGTHCLFCLESFLSLSPFVIYCLYLSFTTHFRHQTCQEAFLITFPIQSWSPVLYWEPFLWIPIAHSMCPLLGTPHSVVICLLICFPDQTLKFLEVKDLIILLVGFPDSVPMPDIQIAKCICWFLNNNFKEGALKNSRMSYRLRLNSF